METIKALALTLEQTEEFVSGLATDECKPVSLLERMKQNLKNGFDGVRQKLGQALSEKSPKEIQTVTILVKEPAKEVENAKAQVEQQAPKKMSDYEYRAYLDSIIF